MSKIVALIQARMSSSRFPGKVLAELGGLPSIVFMVERVRRARLVHQVVVVTSIDRSDDELVAVLEKHRIEVFRGELNDVLSRYGGAANKYEATVAVRLTGDCPLSDPRIIDQVVRLLIESGCDYASNAETPTYADGLDVECFTRDALVRAQEEAISVTEREHVTLWMRSAAAGLERRCLKGLVDSSHIRLTVDYADDLELVRAVVGLLGGAPTGFDYYDMLRCLDENPRLLELNRHARNEGLTHLLARAPGSALEQTTKEI